MWSGVVCSRKHPGRVTALDLGGHGLSGSISASIGNLTSLTELNLSGLTCCLLYSMPSSPMSHRLEVLDLGNNWLRDRIPDAVTNCSNLRILAFVAILYIW